MGKKTDGAPKLKAKDMQPTKKKKAWLPCFGILLINFKEKLDRS